MERRSKGVTFWGWTFIATGIIGLSGVLNPQHGIKLYGVILFFFNIALSIANLVAGIFILKLSETARKAVKFLCVLGLISAPFLFAPLFNPSYGEGYYAKKKQWIIENVRPELQQKALDDLEEINKTSRKILPIAITTLLGGPILILELSAIVFFTRPKVKEQFR